MKTLSMNLLIPAFLLLTLSANAQGIVSSLAVMLTINWEQPDVLVSEDELVVKQSDILKTFVSSNFEYPDLALEYGAEGLLIAHVKVNDDALEVVQFTGKIGYGCEKRIGAVIQAFPAEKILLQSGLIIHVPIQLRIR